MATWNDVRGALSQYQLDFRHHALKPFEVSGLYDLFPQADAAQTDCPAAHRWNDVYPHAARAGVYIILDAALGLLYVGKASMGNSIGARLGTYFKPDAQRQCRVVDGWTPPEPRPRYVVTVAVPEGTPFEAPALEEFLIGRFVPPGNKRGTGR